MIIINREKKSAFYLYSIMFILVGGMFLGIFVLNNKSLIWNADGINQHFPILYDFNEMIREFIKNPSLGFPEWSFEIGYGSDVIGAYSYYILGDPIAYLSLLFPMDKLDIAYGVLIILRLYLAGISFIIYAKKMGYSNKGISLGAISYAFSGFIIMNGIKHPYFINPLIILPLVFLSIEFVLENRKKYLFSIIIAIAMISNFYFFYMIAIITAIYAILRYFESYKNKNSFFIYIRDLFIYGIVGIMISSVILLPSIEAILTSSRVACEEACSRIFLYPISYYINLGLNLISSGSYPFWTILTFPIITIMLLPIFIKQSYKHKTYFYMLIIFTIMLLIPSIGSFMNGMSTISNRWTFSFAFISSIIITIGVDNIEEIDVRDKTYMFMVLLGYSIIGILKYKFPKIKNDVIPIVIIGLFFLILIGYYSRTKNKKPIFIVTTILLLTNIVFNNYYRYSINSGKLINQFIQSDKVYPYYTEAFDGAEEVIKENDSSFYRIGKTDDVSRDKTRNNSIFSNYNGIDSFLSVNNGYLANFSKEVNNRAYTPNSPIINFDNRHIISSIMGVKYYISKEEEARLPNSVKKRKSARDFTIYENEDVMPFGFVYSNIISNKDFDRLSGIEKEESLLYRAAVDENKIKPNGSIDKSKLKEIDFDIKNSTVKINDNTINVDKPNEEIILEINKEYIGNLYLEIDGIEFTSKIDEKKPLYKYLSSINRFNAGDRFTIRGEFRERGKNFNIPDSLDASNNFKSDTALINLGFYNDIKSGEKVKIIFKNPGTYKIDSLKLINMETDEYSSDIYELRSDFFEIDNLYNDRILGDMNSDKSGVLMFQIPYSRGWKITINGEVKEPLIVNKAFLGCEIEKGKNNIELEYKTPLLRIGLIISILGLGILTFLYFKNRK